MLLKNLFTSKRLKKFGTNYGGWFIPMDIQLNSNSIVYSAGVGEDISFDLQLQSYFNCNILLIDPTPRSLVHIQEVRDYYLTDNWSFSGNIQKDYKKKIRGINIDFSKISLETIGLWDSLGELKFYKQDNINNVSQTLVSEMFGNDYDLVKTCTIKNLMDEQKHEKIDLLKLDIEGAEIRVLNNMLDDQIHPTYLCIEFDLKIKGKDLKDDTNKIINRLKHVGYKELINDNLNITFYLEKNK